MNSALAKVTKALANSCEGIVSVKSINAAQLVQEISSARAAISTYAEQLTTVADGDATLVCIDAAERLKTACAACSPIESIEHRCVGDRGSELTNWCKNVALPAAGRATSLQLLVP